MAAFQTTMDRAAQLWLQWMWPMAWQAALLGIVIVGVALLARKASPRFRYFLWCLVLLKLCLPPSLTLVTGFGQWVLPEQAARALARPLETAPPPTVFISQPAAQAIPGAAPVSRAAFRLSWPAALFGAWCIGVLALALLFAIQHHRMGCRLAAGRPVNDEGLLRLLEESKAALGVRSRVELVSAEELPSPILFGVFRPRIVIPRRALESLPADQIRPILLHELAHLRRKDLWLGFVQLFAQILYWFHPAAWLANRQMRRERELIVDDIVLAQLGNQRESYSASLLNIVKQGAQRRFFNPAYLGIVESPGSLARRLKRILDTDRRLSLRLGWAGLILLVALACVLIPQARPQRGADAPGAYPRPAAAASAAPRTSAPVPACPAAAPADSALLQLPVATDADLAALKGRQELRSLSISNGKVTDAGLAYLQESKGLETLRLRGCAQITDAGVAHLKEMTRLSRLDLSGTQVTDAGLENLAKMKGLRTLYLTDTQITDAGVRQIKEFKHLGRLELCGTRITDAGLVDLRELKELAAVLLYRNPQLSEAGLAELRAALPRTKVWTDADLKAALPPANLQPPRSAAPQDSLERAMPGPAAIAAK